MATERPSRRQIREILRRKGVLGPRHREVAHSLRVGYRHTQFCELYRRWPQRRGLSMRQVHRAGEKGFVDHAGGKPTLVDSATGERSAVGSSSPCSAPRTAPRRKLPGLSRALGTTVPGTTPMNWRASWWLAIQSMRL